MRGIFYHLFFYLLGYYYKDCVYIITDYCYIVLFYYNYILSLSNSLTVTITITTTITIYIFFIYSLIYWDTFIIWYVIIKVMFIFRIWQRIIGLCELMEENAKYQYLNAYTHIYTYMHT